MDPIGDLLAQVAGEVGQESTPERERALSRLADHELMEQVRFELSIERQWVGRAYRQLSDDLWVYALPVIKAFVRRNMMGKVLERYAPQRAFPMRAEDMMVLANSAEERNELALDIIAKAIEKFRTAAIDEGKSQWKASMNGASLRTYFIGMCALVYRRTYEKWSRARRNKLEKLADQHDIDFYNIGGIIARDLADPAGVAGIRVDLKRAIDVATPQTKLILGLLAQDMTQVQIAAELGLTVKAVNHRIARFRERVMNPIRPELGRRPVRSSRKAAA